MHKIFCSLMILFASCVLLTSSAFATDLETAKRSGLIGERSNGLVAATLPNPSEEILSLVDTTNAGRLEIYKQTADRENIPLKQVQVLAAEKIYDLAEPGDFIMIGNKWVKK
jgi:uncharacterized protein YdbL (DUF1318 family)